MNKLHQIFNKNWSPPEDDYLGSATIYMTIKSEDDIEVSKVNLVSSCPVFKDSCVAAIEKSLPLVKLPESIKVKIKENGSFAFKHEFLHCPAKKDLYLKNKKIFSVSAKGVLSPKQRDILKNLEMKLNNNDFVPCHTLMRKEFYPEEFPEGFKMKLDLAYRTSKSPALVDSSLVEEYVGLKLLGSEALNHVSEVIKADRILGTSLEQAFEDKPIHIHMLLNTNH